MTERGERTSAEGALLAPFAGLRVAPGYAQAVAAVPYDVLSVREARAAARGRPWSFLHVSRPEIDLAAPPPPEAEALYTGAAAAFAKMIEAGVLIRERKPRFYAYRMAGAGGARTGLVAAASLAAYARGHVKRHEATRPAKVRDRARHIAALGAQTGPVFLLHRADDEIRRQLAAACDGPPLCRCVLDGAIAHALWPIDDAARSRALTRGFDRIGPLYIADGHHRTEAARVAAEAGAAGADARFLCVSFPSDEVRILGYHRIVRDLNGLSVPAFLDAVRKAMRCVPADGPVVPGERRRFGMYVDGRWYDLAAARPPAGEALDVSLLSRLVLEPVLGIGDPREDPRIDFVGGGRGPAALAEAVDSGAAAVAFSLPPPTVEELMAVADAGATMPPKSTWFEPKLADGLVSLVTGAARCAA